MDTEYGVEVCHSEVGYELVVWCVNVSVCGM